jgi:hypothetical protein
MARESVSDRGQRGAKRRGKRETERDRDQRERETETERQREMRAKRSDWRVMYREKRRRRSRNWP